MSTPDSADDRTDWPVREAQHAPHGRLVVVTEESVQTVALPPQGKLLLGRSVECDISIAHPSVSRRHAVLHVGAQVQVEDLGSSFGTRIAGSAVAPGAPTPIPQAAVLELGTVLILIQRDDSRKSSASNDSAMANVRALGELVAKSTISVLIVGETGVGKEVLAETIHESSARAGQPLMRLNCAALPEALLESELFGYERGAFTGAVSTKPGLLEAARGGTVFLDEVAELPAAVQGKLLRIFESREVLRLGGLSPRPVDVRFIAATNRDLGALASTGRFREDLYYRLAGFTLAVPPLRERTDEISSLAVGFLKAACRKLGKATPALSQEAVRVLEARPWPGNIRELRNVLERAALLSTGLMLPPELVSTNAPGSIAPPEEPLHSLDDDPEERQRIARALERAAGNQTRAAELLGVSRRTLLRRLDKYQLARPRKP